MPCGYLALLRRLYSNQSGVLEGQHAFSIRRGVRQGDILSPLLFNAALESTLSKWKQRLGNHGILLATGHERLTNVRYADDLLLFGRSLEDISFMFEHMVHELAAAGLAVNVRKTKLMTTAPEADTASLATFVEVGSQMVELVTKGASHKYLGRMFSGNLRDRGQRNLEHRVACAWMKFHEHRSTLPNKHICLDLRMKLFSYVVAPTALYSLLSTPLTNGQLSKLDAVQRRMLRKMVGWVRIEGEDWSETGHRMKLRLDAAMVRCPTPGQVRYTEYVDC